MRIAQPFSLDFPIGIMTFFPLFFPRRSMLMLLLLLGISVSASAQSRDDGSLYSRFGLGQLQQFPSSQIQALGGGGTALWSYNYVNYSNPASWSRQVVTRASLGVRIDGLETTDAADNSKQLTAGSFNAAQFSFPLMRDQLGLAFSFEPYSRVNYRVQTTGQLISDPISQDTSSFLINYEGTGGLQQIRGGAGVKITNGFRVGASADVIFGIIEEGQRTTFTDTPGFAETNLTTSTRLVGFTGTVGALLTTSNLLGSNDDLSLAASLTLPTVLDGNRALTLGESLDRDTLGAQIQGDLELPLSAQLGIAYQSDNRWILVADALYAPWNDFQSDLSWPGFTPGGTSRFQDRMRFSGGVEFLPAGNDQLDTYFKRVAYRLGFYYDQAYISPVEGIDITTMAVTGGLSLPSLFPGTHLDLNVEVGTRGTTDQDLVRDLFYGVSATLSIGERWFVRRKLR